MRKSGLHKEISSIFDGVDVPRNSLSQEETDPLADWTEPEVQGVSQTDEPQRTDGSPGSALLKRMTAGPSESDPMPVVQVGRPTPLPKSKTAGKVVRKSHFTSQIEKTIFGSQRGSLDPRQKKTAALVGILSLVFAAVMFVSLGGVGKTQAAERETSGDTATTQGSAALATAKNWTGPAPLPKDLRNATAPVILQTAPEETSTEQWTVKGILFSKTNPSAIINNEVLSEGQTFNGITIVKITKNTVEFEANGKRWAQTVQR